MFIMNSKKSVCHKGALQIQKLLNPLAYYLLVFQLFMQGIPICHAINIISIVDLWICNDKECPKYG